MPTNGRLDESQLVEVVNFAPIEAGALGLATPELAHQWALMAAHFQHDLGKILYASEVYRTYERQVEKKREQEAGSGVLAAVPGTSNHGMAVAVDIGSGVGVQTGPEYAWMAAHAAAYGFVNDVTSEGWHWHYCLAPTITTAAAGGYTLLQTTAGPVVAETIPEDIMKLYQLIIGKNQQYVVRNSKGQFIGLGANGDAWAPIIERTEGIKAVKINDREFYALKQIEAGKNR